MVNLWSEWASPSLQINSCSISVIWYTYSPILFRSNNMNCVMLCNQEVMHVQSIGWRLSSGHHGLSFERCPCYGADQWNSQPLYAICGIWTRCIGFVILPNGAHWPVSVYSRCTAHMVKSKEQDFLTRWCQGGLFTCSFHIWCKHCHVKGEMSMEIDTLPWWSGPYDLPERQSHMLGGQLEKVTGEHRVQLRPHRSPGHCHLCAIARHHHYGEQLPHPTRQDCQQISRGRANNENKDVLKNCYSNLLNLPGEC